MLEPAAIQQLTEQPFEMAMDVKHEKHKFWGSMDFRMIFDACFWRPKRLWPVESWSRGDDFVDGTALAVVGAIH